VNGDLAWTNRYCQHATCRAHAFEELAWMARRLMRPELLGHASEALRATVRCRRQPRKGPIHAPFPPER
jgi:hypothetical protein